MKHEIAWGDRAGSPSSCQLEVAVMAVRFDILGALRSDRRIRGITSRLDIICTFVAIASRTVTSYCVCRVLISSWAEIS